jgi:hypothetical protein
MPTAREQSGSDDSLELRRQAGGSVFDLERFTFTEMTQLAAELRRLGAGAESMEEVANRIVRCLYNHFISKQTNQKACVLVRLFKTHPFGELDEDLRHFASTRLQGGSTSPDMKCLILLATAGEKSEWNSREASSGHQAIPLVEKFQDSPMLSGLFSQLGVSFSALQKPDPGLVLDTEQSDFNVFHVPEANGSPFVPAQKEFVIPYGVKSVVGFGGLLPAGDVFMVILFSRVHVPRASAELFKTLALSTKLAMVSAEETRVFA